MPPKSASPAMPLTSASGTPRRAGRPRLFTRAELSSDEVRMPAEVAPDLTLRCRVHHVAIYTPVAPLDRAHLSECEPIQHTLELRISRDELDSGVLDEAADCQGLWQRLVSLPHVEIDRRQSHGPSPSAVVARLRAVEYQDRLRRDWNDVICTPWFDWLDAHGTELGGVADEVANQDVPGADGALSGGSLFHFARLSVHPLFRGQHLGARLLAHALWILTREPYDLVLMEVGPNAGEFGTDNTQSATSQDSTGLLRYYQRLGLRRWRRGVYARATVRDGDPLMPVLYHAASRYLPFTRPDRRRRRSEDDQ